MSPKNEHPQLVINPFLIYIGITAVSALLQYLVPLPFISRQPARIAGVIIMMASFLFGMPAIRGMFKAKTSPNPNQPTSSLVQSGPYRFSRNPMYIGLTLMYAGLVTFLQLPWGIFFIPLVIWLITVWVIRPEEEYLGRKFGDQYLNYKQTVRRWI
jgi:protein-S-isoprenylcysteine O-methyltransferase Ste14